MLLTASPRKQTDQHRDPELGRMLPLQHRLSSLPASSQAFSGEMNVQRLDLQGHLTTVRR
jgi:hypothetical protein